MSRVDDLIDLMQIDEADQGDISYRDRYEQLFGEDWDTISKLVTAMVAMSFTLCEPHFAPVDLLLRGIELGRRIGLQDAEELPR